MPMLARCLTITLLAMLCGPLTAIRAADQQLIEVRIYHLTSTEKAAQFDHMMKLAGMNAIKRAGVGPLGVFQPVTQEGDEVLRVMVLPYESPEAFVNLSERLSSDISVWAGAEDYFLTDKSSPAFTRIESSLLKAFAGMPRLEVPRKADGKRLFEFRIYESFSEVKGKLKVQMFNEGEIELFKQVGLHAVFYGEAMVAANLPNLAYMVAHDSEAEQQAAWDRFQAHPDWNQLKTQDQYQDTVSKIIKHLLVATDYSDIK